MVVGMLINNYFNNHLYASLVDHDQLFMNCL